MKREFRMFIALSIMTVCTAALPATAADNDSLRVTVPFSFTAGAATFPAGDYVISRPFDGNILMIGGKGGATILMTIPEGSAGELRASNLTFERSAKGATLMEVRMEGKPSVIPNHPK